MQPGFVMELPAGTRTPASIYYKGRPSFRMMHLSANDITALHDHSNDAWHSLPAATSTSPDPLASSTTAAVAAALSGTDAAKDSFMALVASQHLANFRLWHVEDLARVPTASDTEIASAKRVIDRINQQRNDLAEQLDGWLLIELGSHNGHESAPLHSETPGMMIDRLSILSLKLFHTIEEIGRIDAPPGHAKRNQERRRVLEAQRSDLAACLDSLWQDVNAGSRRFKIYRQMKMYNDPTLNPALYKEAAADEETVSAPPAGK